MSDQEVKSWWDTYFGNDITVPMCPLGLPSSPYNYCSSCGSPTVKDRVLCTWDQTTGDALWKPCTFCPVAMRQQFTHRWLHYFLKKKCDETGIQDGTGVRKYIFDIKRFATWRPK